MKSNNIFKFFTLSTTWVWLIVFAMLPTLLVFLVSLMTKNTMELYAPPFTLNNYYELLQPIYLKVFARSAFLAASATFLCLVIAYPFAYNISQSHARYKSLLLLLVIIPFWTSSLIRTYAIMAILKAKGLINSLLLSLGLIDQPLQLLYSNTALLIGLIYTLLPFMILPLYANMEKLDHTLIEAAHDLGANRRTVFIRVLLPLTMPGILSGTMLVFLPAMTLFYLPSLLGGAKSTLLGNLIQGQFLSAIDWPLGAATSIALLFIMSLLMIFYWRQTKNDDRRDLL